MSLPADFLCKDSRKCVARTLVCDGRSHCHDGSDEVGCPTIAAPTSKAAAQRCRLGAKQCLDGRGCVLHSHVCDGERDCQDGSDEQGCELKCQPGQKVASSHIWAAGISIQLLTPHAMLPHR